MAVRINCINKSDGDHDNPNEAVSNYGWINEDTGKSGISSRQEMVKWMKQGNRAYVTDRNSNEVDCRVRVSENGIEFLQTVSDGRYTNNLLELVECPLR